MGALGVPARLPDLRAVSCHLAWPAGGSSSPGRGAGGPPASAGLRTPLSPRHGGACSLGKGPAHPGQNVSVDRRLCLSGLSFLIWEVGIRTSPTPGELWPGTRLAGTECLLESLRPGDLAEFPAHLATACPVPGRGRSLLCLATGQGCFPASCCQAPGGWGQPGQHLPAHTAPRAAPGPRRRAQGGSRASARSTLGTVTQGRTA